MSWNGQTSTSGTIQFARTIIGSVIVDFGWTVIPFWCDWRRIGALLGLIGMFAVPILGIWFLS
ncbi:hypothetical protein LCGC14_2396060 [marine sediment metagenome]|uniref:Uncharacterized protein n=1 Tax=marine sediment metagenome TaxID=412755 RepID=A0A0F9ER69_9ZZZZ